MNRRQFLLGAGGVVVGLPLLQSLRRFRGRAVAADGQQRRLIIFFTCNGVNMQTFFPATPYGALTAASFAGRATEPLAPFASKLLIPRGIHMRPRGFGRDGGPGDDHQKGMGHKLTARLLNDSLYASGISVDQLAARSINEGRPPLTMRVGGSNGGNWSQHISYRGDNQPEPGERNPWLIYQDLIGGDGLDDAAVQQILVRRQSVLDLASAEYQELMSQDLSASDRAKLDMHFSAIRDLESDLAEGCALDEETLQALQAIDPSTVGADAQYKNIGKLQIDVLALAIACGKANVATLLWGAGAGGPIFTWDGMAHQYNHHKLSHGNTRDDDSGSAVDGYEQMLTDIDTWHARQFAYLLERLDSYTEGDGTVLDHSCVCWVNELSDGKAHDFRDLPFVLAGSAGGYLKQGQYIKVVPGDDTRSDDAAHAPHNKLLTTMLNAVGATNDDGTPIEQFGDPSICPAGEIAELKA